MGIRWRDYSGPLRAPSILVTVSSERSRSCHLNKVSAIWGIELAWASIDVPACANT
jgi:hypothetical protein